MPYRRKGSDVWQIVVAGVRSSSGTKDRKAAEALESKLRAEAWTNVKMGTKRIRSWQEMCEKWHKERGHKATFDFDLTAIAWWTPFLDVPDIRTITRDVVDEIIQKHRPVTSHPSPQNRTANAYVGIVGSMLNAACEEWDWIERAPKLRQYQKPEGRQRHLTVDEWRILLGQLPQHLKWAATFALATGLRADKVFKLEWQQINLKDRRLTFVGTENKLGNTIPLNETAMGVLTEITDSQFHLTRVFSWMRPIAGGKGAREIVPLDCYGEAWDKALERARFDDVVFHTLRHTFATWLGERGVPEGVIDRLGGWKGSRATRERYTHLNIENLRQYSAVIDHVLAGRDVRFLVAVEAVGQAVNVGSGAHFSTQPLGESAHSRS